MIWTVIDEAEEWAETDNKQEILFACFLKFYLRSWYKIANIQIEFTDKDNLI